ncbi:MAG: DUF4345 domain-containing protein [Anaerolineales bacterium]|nr:DUF4345 domain-containing protein [Anaerolineales bacterium]
MTALEIGKIIAAVGTIATGLIALFRPDIAKGFTGLDTTSTRGVTEIRAILGGGFIGLGLTPFILQEPVVYQALGITYLVIAAVRLISMIVDRSFVQSNTISLIVEIVFGIILVL